MISWSQLESYFETLFPTNNQKLITPSRLKTGLSALLRAFDSVIQFALSSTVTRKIAIGDVKARSWPITLTSATNTIELEAYTSKTRRILLLDENFVIIGQGTKRTFQLTDPYFDDFLPGEKIIYKERIKGSFEDLKLPTFTIVNQDGIDKYAWKIEGQNNDQLQILRNVPSPYESNSVTFNHPTKGAINVNVALQELFERQDKVVYSQAEFLAAQDHPYPRQIIMPDVGIWYKTPGFPIVKIHSFRPNS